MKIYYVEDDVEISNVISKVLTSNSMDSTGLNHGNDFLLEYDKNKPDLILLDIMLPDISGIEILKKVRINDKKTPIIMISALSSEIDKVIALDYGADDYISKPFGINELRARIEAITRNKKDNKLITYNNLILNSENNKVTYNNIKIEFSNIEFKILKYFIENKDEIVSKLEIIDSIWDKNRSFEPRVLDSHLKNIRQLLIKNNILLEILTIYNKGYKLVKKEVL